jgi:hypothetical protein
VSESVNIELSNDEALVLLEFLGRIADDGDWSVEDSAEIRALWNLECLLEQSLAEVFDPNYGEKIHAARDALRDPDGTDASAERSVGRLSLWLEPRDIAFIADEWRKVSQSESEEVRSSWSRIAFRAMSALHKAGINYEPRFPSGGGDDTGTA